MNDGSHSAGAARHWRLLISCPDRRGVVAAVSDFILRHGNILDADQHTDLDADGRAGAFTMRVEIDAEGFAPDERTFVDAFAPIAEAMSMRFSFRDSGARRRMIVLCGPSAHCAADLLWRVRSGELHAEVPLVMSNHASVGEMVRSLGFAFEHVEIGTGGKAAQEAVLSKRFEEHGADLVVLARYMQVVSAPMTRAWHGRMINIHHSFLPAFAGARPYHQAFERGVKVIGATAHYVTQELDDGPIIAQGVAPITHRDGVRDLIRKGRDLERTVLAEAVRLHLEDRVIVLGRKTVVFG